MKFSIMIPCYNGMPYVKTAIDLILRQNYDDYELIVSEDHSTDGTAEYIDTLNAYDHVKILHCPVRMSMAEHWEYVQSFASGDWQIFVGQDDGLQGYFFKLAENLIHVAELKHIDVIMSSRAYYFWNGVGSDGILFSYSAKNILQVLNSKKEMKRALYETSYMELPSMYTTSLFSKNLINRVKEKLGGHLFITHPQDANLAACACLFTDKYLKSYVPLGWVGTSSKSAGFAMTNLSNNVDDDLGKEYFETVKKSSLPYHRLAYDFRIPSCQLYFWSALLSVTEKCKMTKENSFLLKKNTRIKLFSFINADNGIGINGKKLFYKLLDVNGIKLSELKTSPFLKKNNNFLQRIVKRIIFKIFKITSYSLSLDKELSNVSLLDIDRYIHNKILKWNLIYIPNYNEI